MWSFKSCQLVRYGMFCRKKWKRFRGSEHTMEWQFLAMRRGMQCREEAAQHNSSMLTVTKTRLL
eukprot:SAG22_NODE_46_length_24705_cov_89.861010_19_plen_64_part_00